MSDWISVDDRLPEPMAENKFKEALSRAYEYAKELREENQVLTAKLEAQAETINNLRKELRECKGE